MGVSGFFTEISGFTIGWTAAGGFYPLVQLQGIVLNLQYKPDQQK